MRVKKKAKEADPWQSIPIIWYFLPALLGFEKFRILLNRSLNGPLTQVAIAHLDVRHPQVEFVPWRRVLFHGSLEIGYCRGVDRLLVVDPAKSILRVGVVRSQLGRPLSIGQGQIGIAGRQSVGEVVQSDQVRAVNVQNRAGSD